MMKGQLAGLMKQAQAMQDNLKKVQDELATIEVEADNKLSALGEAHELLMSGDFNWINDGTADAPQIERVVQVIDATPSPTR